MCIIDTKDDEIQPLPEMPESAAELPMLGARIPTKKRDPKAGETGRRTSAVDLRIRRRG